MLNDKARSSFPLGIQTPPSANGEQKTKENKVRKHEAIAHIYIYIILLLRALFFFSPKILSPYLVRDACAPFYHFDVFQVTCLGPDVERHQAPESAARYCHTVSGAMTAEESYRKLERTQEEEEGPYLLFHGSNATWNAPNLTEKSMARREHRAESRMKTLTSFQTRRIKSSTHRRRRT